MVGVVPLAVDIGPRVYQRRRVVLLAVSGTPPFASHLVGWRANQSNARLGSRRSGGVLSHAEDFRPLGHVATLGVRQSDRLPVLARDGLPAVARDGLTAYYRSTPHLLHEDRNPRRSTLRDGLSRPGQLKRSCAGSAFTAYHNPIKVR